MTTEAAAAQYLAEHLAAVAGRDYAVYNPHGKQHDELPWIIGFNNGGELGWLRACLIAQDGTPLGEHICSHEGYMSSDLGVIEDTSPDRHVDFRAHYPDGYRMDFVGYDYIKYDPRLIEAFRLHAVQRGKTGEKEIGAVKHTSGPLHAEHDDEALATYVVGPDGMTTACLSWTLVGGPSKEEQRANGVLYAASPAMLKALKQTYNVIINILTDPQLDVRLPCGQTIRQYSTAVCAAIEQAEGK